MSQNRILDIAVRARLGQTKSFRARRADTEGWESSARAIPQTRDATILPALCPLGAGRGFGGADPFYIPARNSSAFSIVDLF